MSLSPFALAVSQVTVLRYFFIIRLLKYSPWATVEIAAWMSRSDAGISTCVVSIVSTWVSSRISIMCKDKVQRNCVLSFCVKQAIASGWYFVSIDTIRFVCFTSNRNPLEVFGWRELHFLPLQSSHMTFSADQRSFEFPLAVQNSHWDVKKLICHNVFGNSHRSNQKVYHAV